MKDIKNLRIPPNLSEFLKYRGFEPRFYTKRLRRPTWMLECAGGKWVCLEKFADGKIEITLISPDWEESPKYHMWGPYIEEVSGYENA